jgi:hypothetical protein
MRKWLLPAFFVISIGILGGCAKKTLIPVAPDNPDAYQKAKAIFVILKTGEAYEMKDFSVRGDSLAGTRVFRDEKGVKRDEQKTSVALDNVSTVQVEKATGRSFAFFGMGFGLGLGIAAAGVAALIILITSSY